jgi:hypothetical protein
MTGFGIDDGNADARLKGLLNPASPVGLAAQDSAAESMKFMQWVSEQSHNVSKLKVFHDMAKKINDA